MDELHEAVRDQRGSVAVDLFENESIYVLVIDLPGASIEGTTVETTDRSVEVRVERSNNPPADAEALRTERPDRLSLELPMPPDADAELAEASLANGVLELRIPRGEVGTEIPIGEE